jgi:hypothetical protein
MPIGDTSRRQDQDALPVLLDAIAPGLCFFAVRLGQGFVYRGHRVRSWAGKSRVRERSSENGLALLENLQVGWRAAPGEKKNWREASDKRLSWSTWGCGAPAHRIPPRPPSEVGTRLKQHKLSRLPSGAFCIVHDIKLAYGY